MGKKIIVLLLSVVLTLGLVAGVMVSAAPVEQATYTVVADKSATNPGDTINFSVKLELINPMTAFEGTISIPDGLTLVPGSLKTIAASDIGFDLVNNNEVALLFSGYGSTAYAGTEAVVLATFQCVVDTNAAAGNFMVTLIDTVLNDDEYEEENHDVAGAKIAVTVPVTGVSLDKTSIRLGNSQTATLVATIAPANATNKKIVWTSSNPAIATVNQNGAVTPGNNSGGKVTITATTEDGKKTASCEVTVYCEHGKSNSVSGKDPTCTQPGNNAYDICGICGVIFKAGTSTETTVDKETIPALKHDFTKKVEDLKYLVAGSGANCQSVKKYYYACSRCDAIGTATFDGTVGEHRMETAWTSKDDQHYHKCAVSGCTYVEDKAFCTGGSATCLEKAVCATCRQPYGSLAACDFMAEKVDSKYLKSEATCSATAIYYKSCTICSKISENTFVYGDVNADNHVNTEIRNQADSNCTENGYSGDTWCMDCQTQIVSGEVIPSGHKLETVEEKIATHEADGNIAYCVCTACGKLFADEEAMDELTEADTVIPKGEHSYGKQYDANNHWQVCDCGSVIDSEAHSYGEWVIVKEAAVEVEGSKERACSVCEHKETEVIPALTPETGDNEQIGLLFAMLLISACGVVAVSFIMVYRKRSAYQR